MLLLPPPPFSCADSELGDRANAPCTPSHMERSSRASAALSPAALGSAAQTNWK